MSICLFVCVYIVARCFFFQAEDGIRDLVRSRGLGDVYKRQQQQNHRSRRGAGLAVEDLLPCNGDGPVVNRVRRTCLLYTSDAADERSSVDLGGRRIIKKKN